MIRSLATLAILVPGVWYTAPASAQIGRAPDACLELAAEHAAKLASMPQAEALAGRERALAAGLDELAAEADIPAPDRLERARSILGTREARSAEREGSAAMRALEAAKSVVAGWRGLYCPVARPEGPAAFSGRERCDALAAAFVDRLRIQRRSSETIRTRERLESERQSILNARVPRAERNDLLEFWRLRSERFEMLENLARYGEHREAAAEFLDGLKAAGCARSGQS